MAESSLLNIPAAALEAVLHLLADHDYGSLRQVSRSFRETITQHVPYIIMRLSGSSSAEQMQQWCKITRELHHANNIHIYVTGKAPTAMFELAMQMLSQHFKDITELHLLPSDYDTSSSSSEDTGPGPAATDTACIASLLPLKHLLSRLRALVVCGVSVQDLADDLQQLGAAATAAGHCWQLQSLTLRAYWTDVIRLNYRSGEDHATPVLWSCFSDALMQISKAFPDLQQLTVHMPPIGLEQLVPTAAGYYADYQSEYLDTSEGASCSWLADTLHIIDDYDKDIDYTDSSMKSHAATAQVAAVAALANAAVQLQKLQQLTVSELPDLWTTRKQFLWHPPTHVGRVSRQLSAIAIAKARASSAASAAAVDAVYDVGLPLTISAAAAAFGTLDEFGCWLLQQHASLRKVHTNTVQQLGYWNHAMSWQRQERCVSGNDGSISGIADSSTAADLLNIHVSMDCSRTKPIGIPWPPTGSSSSNDDADADDYDESVTSNVSRELSLCSFRPAVLTMCHVSSCSLRIDELNVAGLADLLGDLKSLKHLEIMAGYPQGADQRCGEVRSAEFTAAVSATMAAVATVQSLESLHLWAEGSDILVPDDLLLPLTAAAAGPCSSLTRLELIASFKETAVAGDSSGSAADCGIQRSHALKQLKGLRDLEICHWGSRKHKFFLECLPAGLECFRACQLSIYSKAVEAGDLAAGDAACDVAQRMAVAGAHAYPTLQQLFLNKCQLSSPSILASDQLQQLTVTDSAWAGGWAAAAAAWPNVTKLVWTYDVQFSSHNGSSSEGKDAYTRQPSILNDKYTAHHMLLEIAVGFKQLRSLTLKSMPCMRVEVFAKVVLQPVVQQMHDIHYLQITSACMVPVEVDELQGLEGEAAAAVTELLGDDGSSNNSSLHSISGGSVNADLNSVQQWLQDHLPWASIAVSDAKPIFGI